MVVTIAGTMYFLFGLFFYGAVCVDVGRNESPDHPIGIATVFIMMFVWVFCWPVMLVWGFIQNARKKKVGGTT